MGRSVSMVGQSSTEILERLQQRDSKTEQTQDGKEENAVKEEKQSIFAGNLNLIQNSDPVEQKRKEAQRQAMKMIQDAWETDIAIDNIIQESRDHYAKMVAVRNEAQDEIMSINEDKEAARELYGVDADSQEQKDLELLYKQMDYKNGDIDSELSADEWKRIMEINKEPLTEYQQRGLELHKRTLPLQSEMREAEKQMKGDQASIRAIKLKRLEKDPMVEAQREAKEIRENASREIIGLLQNEAVENIDEAREEAEEKAEETTQEKKEQQEQMDEAKLERAKREAMMLGTEEAVDRLKSELRKSEAPEVNVEEMVDIARSYSHSSDVKQSLEEIKNNMNLLEADLKGIQVDQEA